MENLKLSELINPQPKQKIALQTLLDPHCKYLLFGGAMSGGKSYVLRWGAVTYALYLYLKTGIKGIPLGIFSEDYPTLKDRQISRISREFPRWLGELKDTKEDGLGFFVRPEYGAGKILLRNLDDPSKYMSTEFAAEFVEELTRNSYQTFEDLRNRLRYPGIAEVKFMGASNPGGIGHGWVKKYFIDKITDDPEQERFFYVHANAFDNKYISHEYIMQLESLPEAKKKAYLYGSWDVFAGQYFTEWNGDLHTCPPFVPKKGITLIGGMDWGRANPFSFHLSCLQLKTYTNEKNETIKFYRVFTFYEAYGVERTPREWAEIIKEHLKRRYDILPQNIQWIQGDPAMFTKGQDMSISIKDQFLQEGIRIQAGSNDRIGGWENMHKWLSMAPDGLPYWIVAETCPNLIRTLPQLVHDENRIEDVDTTGEDHAGDSMRYMLKKLKWIDGAKIGGIGSSKPKTRKFFTAKMDTVTGKQIPIDLDKFENALKKRRVYYPR